MCCCSVSAWQQSIFYSHVYTISCIRLTRTSILFISPMDGCMGTCICTTYHPILKTTRCIMVIGMWPFHPYLPCFAATRGNLSPYIPGHHQPCLLSEHRYTQYLVDAGDVETPPSAAVCRANI